MASGRLTLLSYLASVRLYWGLMYTEKKEELDMRTCPKCGAVVSGMEVLFHKCPPSIENRIPKDFNIHWLLKNITFLSYGFGLVKGKILIFNF